MNLTSTFRSQNTFRNLATAALLALASLMPAAAQTPDKAAIEAVIKDYLLKNPEVIQEAMVELERRQKEAEAAAVKKITADPKSPLYTSEHHTVVGNPNGDVTLVEFFDFNCGFCKKGLADIVKVIETDKNVRVIFKEFPILAPGSRDASIVALALREQFDKDKLLKFHVNLLNAKGSIGKELALGVAKDMGADLKKLEVAMASPGIPLALEESKLLADALGINGTPSYIVAEDLVVGARGYGELQKRIASWRQCKKAEC
ncbi:MAG: disulfide bond formation protein DsbA [Rhizobiales bacterium PAR1]|nr:MAG: disulfide bond formation protein DsbA [Rhizobiales bacterium PAR1]